MSVFIDSRLTSSNLDFFLTSIILVLENVLSEITVAGTRHLFFEVFEQCMISVSIPIDRWAFVFAWSARIDNEDKYDILSYYDLSTFNFALIYSADHLVVDESKSSPNSESNEKRSQFSKKIPFS